MKQAAAQPVEIVVRRGALRRFDQLKKKTAELDVVVSWDRRTDQRRGSRDGAGSERRAGERRQEPPFTWRVADFVVVAPPVPRASSKKKTKA